MLPPFKIAPWELPPDCDASLVAPADFVFRSSWQCGVVSSPRETEIRVRPVAYKDAFLHFFCDGERERNGNWILSNTGTFHPFSNSELKLEPLISWFQDEGGDLWHESVTRLVFFDGARYGFPGPHSITIAPTSGQCLIRWGTAPFDEEADRNGAMVGSPFTTRKTPARAAMMKNQLFAALDDENSQARFALEWIHLSLRQQQEKVFSLEAGKISEMQTLLRAALQSQTGIWHGNEPLLWRTRDRHKRPPYPAHWHNDDLTFARLADFRVSYNFDIPPRLKLWKQVVWSFFAPSVDEELLQFANRNRNGDDATSTIAVEANPPSAHEQTEALLLLRDWWQKNFAPQLFGGHNANETP